MKEFEIKHKIARAIAERQMTVKGINDATDTIYKLLQEQLTLTDVVSCVCKTPEPRLKVSENGTYAYCSNCAKAYLQK